MSTVYLILSIETCGSGFIRSFTYGRKYHDHDCRAVADRLTYIMLSLTTQKINLFLKTIYRSELYNTWYHTQDI